MVFVILDLEWNSAKDYDKNKHVNEIIEIGAVKATDKLDITDTFESFVCPTLSTEITKYVTELTKLTFDDLINSPLFCDVFEKFQEWLPKEDFVLLTWSTTDILVLIEDYKFYLNAESIPFLTHFCNMQAYVQNKLNYQKSQLGLNTAAIMLDLLDAEENSHRALDDSLLALEVLKKVYENDLDPYIQKTDMDFFENFTAKTFLISDISDKRINKRTMRCSCPICKTPAKRYNNWKYKTPFFSALFVCSNCSHKFFCRMQFSVKRGNLSVKRRYQSIIQNTNQKAKEMRK